MESNLQGGRSFDDCSVIIVGDSDEEDEHKDDTEGICLTQLEFNVLTQQRDQFVKSDSKTIQQYQNLIQQEVACLQTILARHRLLGDSNIEQNSYIINVKQVIASFCLELILNDPVEVSFWNQYVEFCLDFSYDCAQQRDEVFESILSELEHVPVSVYSLMSFCEHKISGNYEKARSYLSRGIQKHKDCLELYTTRLTLEMGECYSKRFDFIPNKMYTQEEKEIQCGNHIFETYTAIRSNFNMKESRVVQALDKLAQNSCEEFPCSPVHQLKLKFLEDWKQSCPEGAVAEVVSLEADLLLDAMTESNVHKTLGAVFKTYVHTYVACDRKPEILHRAIATFRSLNLESSAVRVYLYLVLDIALHYRCLEPEHVDFYFKQLELESNTLADSKTKMIFRLLGKDARLNASTDIWHLKFGTLLRLYGPDEACLGRLMKMAGNSLGNARSLLVVFARVFSRMLTSGSDKQSVVCLKAMFAWLNANLIESPSEHAEMTRMLISLLIARCRHATARDRYMKLKEVEPQSSIHSELLGQLLLHNTIKPDPDAR